ncbi:hypothetical protein K2173_013057 [Erythroxylum novogranatense]|uniref:BSD domain-containing protein n=1 Tax=Erythroxylum novogranatense TaxID=1862640 RepID=A0AAV8S5T7_9ROSI|nr:hypothetical protein K2173_013057 [Erythroxylum novogranatense]
MNFFNSVFSDDPTPPDSPTADSTNSATWSFGGLVQSLADTYRRDLEELGSGLRKETAVLREVASRAVKDLPVALEAGASVAQNSLETVGKAVDDIGATFSALIIPSGTGSTLERIDLDDRDRERNSSDIDHSRSQRFDVKRYSRFDNQLRAIQCNWDTYGVEPEDKVEYEKWRAAFWGLEQRREEISNLMNGNGVIREIFDGLVPDKVDEDGFWSRYFYRRKLVKRAIAGEEEEELSWDFDDGDEDGESSGNVELERRKVTDESDEEVKSKKAIDRCNPNLEGEGKVDNEGSTKDSDLSLVSSQSLLQEEEDLDWDEIEDVGNKELTAGGGTSASGVDLKKTKLSVAEENEDLSWDIEEDDSEAVKS